jgi:hypothetical protein
VRGRERERERESISCHSGYIPADVGTRSTSRKTRSISGWLVVPRIEKAKGPIREIKTNRRARKATAGAAASEVQLAERRVRLGAIIGRLKRWKWVKYVQARVSHRQGDEAVVRGRYLEYAIFV